MNCLEHGQYHADHGCGTAVMVGSSYAEHCLGCALSPAFRVKCGIFKPNDGENYPPWEAPAGNCPSCWHRSRNNLTKGKVM